MDARRQTRQRNLPVTSRTMYTPRNATTADQAKIMALYRKVAAISGGIARSEKEITPAYIRNCMRQAHASGIQLVVEDPNSEKRIIGEIHTYKFAPKVFAHVLGELTVALDPGFHGRGIGKTLFTALLDHVASNRDDILRVELLTQESNIRALNLYKSVGFVVEGRLQHRIRMFNDRLDADIPMAWFNPNFREPVTPHVS